MAVLPALLLSIQSAMRPQNRIVIPNRVIRLSRPRHLPKRLPMSSLDGKRPFQYGPLTAKQLRILMTDPKPTPPESKKTPDAHTFLSVFIGVHPWPKRFPLKSPAASPARTHSAAAWPASKP